VESLQAQLREGSALAKFAAAYVLFRARRPTLRLLPALLESLELPDGDRRFETAQMLVQLARLEPTVRTVLLHDAAQAEAAQRRRMAIFALRELAPEDPATEQACIAALSDVDPSVARAGLASLAKLHDPTRDTFERVLDVLRAHPDLQLRQLATAVAAQLLRHHLDAETILREALEQATHGPESLARAAKLSLARL